MWDNKGNQVDWQFIELPEWLNLQKKLLLIEMIGKSPVHYLIKDHWGQGNSGKYTAVQGYSALQTNFPPSCPAQFWKFI